MPKKQLDGPVQDQDVVSTLIIGDQCTVTFLAESDMGGVGSPTEDVTVTLNRSQVTRMNKVIVSALKKINKE